MNPRLQKTKKSLQDALILLLDQQDLDDITVTQLCTAANINRTTFYKYYTVPSDVLFELVDELVNKSSYHLDIQKAELYDYVLANCLMFLEHRQMMTAFISHNGNLSSLVHQVCQKRADELTFLRNHTNVFVAGGISHMLYNWMILDYPQPPEEIARIATDHAHALLKNIQGNYTY